MLSLCLLACLFSFMASLFFLFTTSMASDAERYTACAPFSCGYLHYNISYPFWNSNQPNYCGDPAFKLTCEEDMVTMIIKSTKFQVIRIHQESKTFKLLALAIMELDSACPKYYANVTLNLDFLFYTYTYSYTSRDDEYTLLYDCNVNPYMSTLSSMPLKSFECVGDGGHHERYFVSTKDVANYADFGCKNNITLPAFKYPFDPNLTAEYILAKGFEVGRRDLDEGSCDDCVKSGGRCGYNVNATIHASMCFCLKEQYGRVCSKEQSLPTSSKQKWEWKAFIVVVFCVFGALAVIIGIYFYRCRMESQSLHFAASENASALPLKDILKCEINIPIIASQPSSEDLEEGSKRYGVDLFSYTELDEATNNFDSSRILGDGGTGVVYYGKLRDGFSVAVKRLYEHRVKQFKNELQILIGLEHPNLVRLYGCTPRHNRELLLVYEYVSNGTVVDHLHGDRASTVLSWPRRMSIAVETASALKYLHASQIVHRDVKTKNILLDIHFHVKVADFGLSRLFPDDVTHVLTTLQGTAGYMDPEYHQSYHLTSKSDVFSFGVVLIELISSLRPVDITRPRGEINLADLAIIKIQNQALHELVDASLDFESDSKVHKMINEVAKLAFQCLQSSKEIRPSMGVVLDTLVDIQSYGSQPEGRDVKC